MANKKTRRDENFPVGSLLISPEFRADVHAYYQFARIADDIADSVEITSTDKTTRLNALERIVREGLPDQILSKAENDAALSLSARFTERNLPTNLATDLLEAFRQDAANMPCRTWADLINYCQFSACPVGRFLLALHSEEYGSAESDALSSALQILNHIQDAKDDWSSLNRIYIPSDWMKAEGVTPDDLTKSSISPGLRRTIDRLLENTETLIERAVPLPKLIKRRGLAAEAMICITLAQRLSRRLKLEDLIAKKVSLSFIDWVMAASAGLLRLVKP